MKLASFIIVIAFATNLRFCVADDECVELLARVASCKEDLVERDPETNNVIGVRLNNLFASDSNVELISKIPSLKKLKIACNNEITNAGYAPLRNMASLRHFDVAMNNRELPDDFFLHIPQIHSLTLRYLELPENGFQGIENIEGLSNLTCHNVKGITSDSIMQLSESNALDKLDFRFTRLKRETIALAVKVTNVTSIKFTPEEPTKAEGK